MWPRIKVIVSSFFPYDSLDPEKPGQVHGGMVGGTLFVSKEAFAKLQALPQGREFDAQFPGFLSGLKP